MTASHKRSKPSSCCAQLRLQLSVAVASSMLPYHTQQRLQPEQLSHPHITVCTTTSTPVSLAAATQGNTRNHACTQGCKHIAHRRACIHSATCNSQAPPQPKVPNSTRACKHASMQASTLPCKHAPRSGCASCTQPGPSSAASCPPTAPLPGTASTTPRPAHTIQKIETHCTSVAPERSPSACCLFPHNATRGWHALHANTVLKHAYAWPYHNASTPEL